MFVPVVRFPGTWIDVGDGELAHRVLVVTEGVVLRGLDEAAISLHLFQLALQELGFINRHTANGVDELPERYRLRLPFLFARMFVFSLDSVVKGLKVMAQEMADTDYGAGLGEILDIFLDEVPDLIGIRDTAHHAEDRALFRDRRGERIDTAPIDVPGFVRAPQGNLVLDSLAGTTYITTLENGNVGRIEVTEDTLRVVQSRVQDAIDAIPWTGWPRQHPRA